MTLQEAIKWFEDRVPQFCTDCPKIFDFTCSGADLQRCDAYRMAIAAISICIKEMITADTVTNERRKG